MDPLTVADMRRSALRAEVLISVGPAGAGAVRWARATMPTLLDVGPLRPVLRGEGVADLLSHGLLRDFSVVTQLEQAQGNWEGVMARIGGGGRGSVAASAEAFALHVAPSMEATSTRKAAWAAWRTVLTWACARGALGRIMPMSLSCFQAITFDMLSVLCSASVIRQVWDTIQGQHRRLGYASPVQEAGGYARLVSRGVSPLSRCR